MCGENKRNKSTFQAAHPVIGPACFIFYIFVVFFILLNMFLVILMRSYSDSSNRGNVDVIAAEVRKVMTQQLIRMKEFIKDRLAEVRIDRSWSVKSPGNVA